MGELRAAAESALTTDDELLSVLTVTDGVTRRLDQVMVSAVAVLQRRGTFAERGYNKPAAALSDLLGREWVDTRRYVIAAEHACERIGLDGTVLPARLPATGTAFTAGHASLRHVEVIACLLATAAAGRLSEGQRVGVEEQLAAKTAVYTPRELRSWGTKLIDALDEDGPQPDDPDSTVNELVIRRHHSGSGGTIKATFDDAAMFDAIASVIDAKAKPFTKDDMRGVGRRQAEALAEVCGWVLNHGDRADIPDTGGA
jgi:Domain of unknown function (DUF222)